MDSAMGLFHREGCFYAELADTVPVAKPVSYGVGDGDTTPLLLEDLAALRMGDQMDGLTLEDARTLMDALADLHAAFWEKPDIQADWLASPAEGVFAGMICQLVASGAPALAERYSERAPAEVLAAVAEAAPDWQRVLTRIAEGPQTLAHNDCRLDNLFFDDAGTPVFIDWQLAARTRGTQDVGYLLAGSMDSGQLSANWEDLVRRYHDRLMANGVAGYSLDECIHHYRQTVLYPLGAGMALLGAMDIGDGRGLGDAIVLRCLNHIAELDSFEAV
jgi:aminoglycoside phosphotransferase (APT) family kinase protein